MGDMGELLFAALLFVGGHFGASAPPVRGRLVVALGERAFVGLCSVAAIALLLWMVTAYAGAPYVELWRGPGWTRIVTAVLMAPACLLLVCGYSQYNPTAVINRFELRPDPAPGVLKITRHPVMWAIGLWAVGHIPPNGDLASLIFFGALAALALAGTMQIDAKRAARDGESFRRFAEVTSNVPLAALASAKTRAFYKTAYGVDPTATLWREIGLARLAGALGVYLALVYLHPVIIGVPVR